MKAKKMLIFSATWGYVFELNKAWCQINMIDANFHLQKRLEILDINSAHKIWSKKDKGVESALPHAN